MSKKDLQMDQSTFETNVQWKAFYKTAGIMALLIVIAGLVDAITSMMGGEARDNSTVNVVEWFNLFQTNQFFAFSNLGLINTITLSLGIPIYLALYRVHRREQPAPAALASILFFIGTAVYLSSNTVFSLFALSRQYAVAAETQKPLLEATGRALLAQGADLTPGTFMGFFFTQTAGTLITIVMLRGGIFGRWTALTGLAGFSLMSVFFVLAAFVSEKYDTAMVVSLPGGLLLMAYQILLARRFFQLGRS
ncbi:MAG: hypothetical protein IT308_06565 [Anaerolineaceae bacterium]|nr:hypothetical protein [Anaerolineaceae bacterium]